ncbi:MAG: hypothetical protein RIS75_996 [Actinomycetota bacterium]
MTDSQWSKKQPDAWTGDPVGTPPAATPPPTSHTPAAGVTPAPPQPGVAEKRIFPVTPMTFGGLFSASWELLIAARKRLFAIGLAICIGATVTGFTALKTAIDSQWIDSNVVNALRGVMPEYLSDPSAELSDAQLSELLGILASLVLGMVVFSVLILGFFQCVGTALSLRVTSTMASQTKTVKPSIKWGTIFGAWLIQNFAPLVPFIPSLLAFWYGFSDPLSDAGILMLGSGFLFLLIGIPFSVLLYALFIPMMLVAYNENLSGIKLIRRTAYLTKGGRWMSLFLVFIYSLMAGMVPNVAAQVLAVISNDPLSTLGILSITLSSTLALILAVPFSAAVMTVIYANQLVRKDPEMATKFYQ